jgi:hypothetical protein
MIGSILKLEELEWKITRIVKRQNPIRNRGSRQRPVVFGLRREAHFRHPRPKLKAQGRIFPIPTKQVTSGLQNPIRQQTLMQEGIGNKISTVLNQNRQLY